MASAILYGGHDINAGNGLPFVLGDEVNAFAIRREGLLIGGGGTPLF